MEYNQFYQALLALDKDTCVKLMRQSLDANEYSLLEYYQNFFVRALVEANGTYNVDTIWREHIQSGIIRTLIEMCYEKVMPIPKGNLKALVFCLEEEYHELGARMTADMLSIEGVNVHFIGANTPAQTALTAIEHNAPHLVCLSVTNYYHLSRLQHFLEQLAPIKSRLGLKVLVGGYAIAHTPHAKDLIHADYFSQNLADIAKILEVFA